MEKLSITLITRNEETNILPCLESIRWANEIIISDSGSTDNTTGIASKFTDKIYSDPWYGFGKQKNLCADRASHRWILNIDADERVSNDLREEIFQVLRSSSALHGYYIPRKNYFCGQWIKRGGWYPDYNLRLYRREFGRFSEREVHEAVVLRGSAGYFRGNLEHYTYDSIADYLQRMDRYSTLAARELAKGGEKAGLTRLIMNPAFTFLKMYFLQGAILEGYNGLVLSILYSFYTFAKYSKLREKKGNPE